MQEMDHVIDSVHVDSTRSKTGEDKSGENEPHSKDPFKIYDLLKKNNNNTCNSGSEELKYPPGFTPSFNDQKKIGDDNLQGISLGNKAKRRWINELCQKHKINFVTLQEMKAKNIDLCSIKELWGNLFFDHVVGSSVGCSGGEANGLIRLKKKLQFLKIAIKAWTKEAKMKSNEKKFIIQQNLLELDKLIDQGRSNEEILCKRIMLINDLHEINSNNAMEVLERDVSYDEVKGTVWDCGTNKSSGPDGFSFEFYRKYWSFIDQDIFMAVKDFFMNGCFPRGCNSSFIALIPKIQDAKFVKDFRPISLIGSVYKSIAKILVNRLCLVLPYLISDVQSAFVSNRQILDGPFILNELISWCKHKKFNGMIFKVDFEKAFDSVKWDYLDETLKAFGFGQKWCTWIGGCPKNAMGSVLVNGNPSSEFQFFKGLKQGDPLSPFLFILIMETLHLSFMRILNARHYKGISFNDSFTISHLFYADDVVFVGEWNDTNIYTLLNVLKCFYLTSGLKINLQKSKLMGIGVNTSVVETAANLIGCSILSSPFNYLGVKVG
ncbi:RNA-directed DNA polymerase, eukaryota [Tanacetum coccineum]